MAYEDQLYVSLEQRDVPAAIAGLTQLAAQLEASLPQAPKVRMAPFSPSSPLCA